MLKWYSLEKYSDGVFTRIKEVYGTEDQMLDLIMSLDSHHFFALTGPGSFS